MPIDRDIQERLSAQAGAISARNSSSTGYYERTLRESKYNVNVFQYPADLGNQDLLHYIEFSINVRGRSELDKSKRLFEVQRDPDSGGLTTDEVATVATAGTGVAAGAVAFGLTKTILGKYVKTGAVPGNTAALGTTKAADVAIAGAVGVGTGYAASKALNANQFIKPDTTYRISDVIALYVDGPPTVKYGMNYANKELGTLAGIVKGGVKDTLQALNPLSEQGAAAFTAFAKLPSAFGVDLQSALSASSKTSLNPFREVIFESVDFRTFNFKYRFLPKNKQESEAVRNIIKLFKYHMHPDLTPSKLFFIYPSEFQITYYFKTSENLYFHKLAPCALVSMEVSYGGDMFTSFDDGNPSEVNVVLTFNELEILTKKMIDKGY